jgi:seryl-tRNA(Sec) selenium transferase
VPSVFLDTRAVAVTADNISSAALEENLRRRFSIICRVTHDRVLLDVRTLLEGDDKTIADAFRTLCEEAK